MSDPTDVAVEKPGDPTHEFAEVLRHIESLVSPDEIQMAQRFAELFFVKTAAEFISARPPADLAKLVVGAFRFLSESRSDDVSVQVLNPDEENEGWYAPVTVIRTNVSERPFIVDTLREFLHSEDLTIEHYVYPVLAVSRTPEGRVYDIRPSAEGEARESLTHCEIARVTDEARLGRIKEEVRRRLNDVVKATRDFGSMIDQVNGTIEDLGSRSRVLPDRAHEIAETQAFLRWLRDGGFVFLGYRRYDVIDLPDSGEPAVRVDDRSGLGILSEERASSFAKPVPVSQMDPGIRAMVEGGPVLIISKTNAESTVHRRARMDYIGVKRLADDGSVRGEDRFIGLFTSRAFSEDAENIPILRQMLAQILDVAGAAEGSHDFKEIITIFNTMPKEELFLSEASVVGKEIQTVLTTYHTHEIRVTIREDVLQRGAAIMVILPREKFSAEVRKAIEAELVRRVGGDVLNYHLALGTGDQARLHFYLSVDPDKIEHLQPKELEAAVRLITRTWADAVEAGLNRVRPPDEARQLARRYAEAFSPEYQAATDPDEAVRDVLELESMRADGRLESILLHNPDRVDRQGDEPHTVLKLYMREGRMVLSDFMPILENCGLRVLAVAPFELRGASLEDQVVYAFQVQGPEGMPLDPERHATLLARAILAVRTGDATNDSLNSLVVQADMAWRQIDVIRAYSAYAFQASAVPSRQTLPAALRKYPSIAQILFRLFKHKFDPEGISTPEERAATTAAIQEEFREALNSVQSLADDRALRQLATLIDATVRTNYYRHGGRAATVRSGGVPYIALKFDCDRMRDLAGHRLLYEVWVRSSRMEGIHLRGAHVARGGIRWSDRHDDFRKEVLGLVNTQMVKNAVIVPAGSKGGFITFRELVDREARAEEAKIQYQTLMRGLLDITDNLTDGRTVPPVGVYRYDGDDPYLVVAADKGTAQFSDVANAISGEYDFWLDDAFASGGSHGYDHKAVGITARGAWECVKRHFLEKGKDIQSEPFTVAGIGDMSGDVFGNGMLLSRQIKLIAAFDHRHIFIDPNPDAAASFAERQRMFDLGRSSWEDYDRSVLSPGAIIVSRGAKEVALSDEAKAALGLPEETDTLDGEALIRAVLQAPVELLWNGGIGTYVKASYETDADVGDPGNDRVRISVPELRAEIVGEGGNLGFTQEARIEYALRNGRLNTDALDNSGGVDLSDREVNLKILLGSAVAAGEFSQDERNALLEALTDEVADLVLEDNASQSLAVSLDQIRSRDNEEDFRNLMTRLEAVDLLDRVAARLPSWETISGRQDKGVSFTRPELAVLLSYSKIHVTGAILDSALPEDPAAHPYLFKYFPADAVDRAGRERVHAHRLKREIIASQLTNDLVDLMGSTFVNRVADDTGASAAEVARAWLTAARLADHQALIAAVSDLGEQPPRVTYRWLLGLSRVLERTTRWVLTNVPDEESVEEIVVRNRDRLERLRSDFPDLVRGEDADIFENRVQEMVRHGAPEPLARKLMTLRFLDHLLEILVISRKTGTAPSAVADAYYRVSDMLQIPWIRREMFRVAGPGRWEQRAAQSLRSELGVAHHGLTTCMIAESEEGGLDDAATRVAISAARGFDRVRALVDEIRESEISLVALSLLVSEISALAGKVNGH